jgi:RNA polymerase sigma factor (TIGR02999 family)
LDTAVAEPAIHELTHTLRSLRDGDAGAQHRLVELAYDQLRRMAAGLMRGERPDHTLQPTALVHEAVLRFFHNLDAADDASTIANRAYFFGAMSQAMRRILVEHARHKATEKRGGRLERIPLDVTLIAVEQVTGADMLQLDELLQRLEKLDPRTCQVAMLRCFAGLELDEIARQLQVSPSTIDREWRFARAWLKEELCTLDSQGET